MGISSTGWANKNGTGDRSCKCTTWQKHWIKHSKKEWPSECSVAGCKVTPSLGAHIYHPEVDGERIVPMCNSCNGLGSKFSLKGGTSIIKASQNDTCG